MKGAGIDKRGYLILQRKKATSEYINLGIIRNKCHVFGRRIARHGVALLLLNCHVKR